MNHSHVNILLALNANTQLAHWQADTITNAHKTLGDFYSAMNSLTDRLVEVAFGKNGNTAVAPGSVSLFSGVAHAELLAEWQKEISAILAELGESDCDLENIVADMQIELNQARYLLKV